MTQQFKCQQPDCDEQVIYEEMSIEAVLPLVSNKDGTKRKSKIVYLTCAKGHIYPYRVETEE